MILLWTIANGEVPQMVLEPMLKFC